MINKDYVNTDQILLECFKNVPKTYFEKKFIFDFNLLDKNTSNIAEA